MKTQSNSGAEPKPVRSDMPRLYICVSNIPFHNTGSGGHLYTVKDHAAVLSKYIDAELICFGHEVPKPLASTSIPVRLVRYQGITSIPGVVRHLASIANRNPRAVFHTFDMNSLLFVRLAGLFQRLRIISTKCGGAVTNQYTPACHPDIVFHAQDFDFYANQGFPNKNRRLKLIPNRVNRDDLVSLDHRNYEVGTTPGADIRILRIARLCTKYEESILQTLRLAQEFRRNNVSATATLIGYPEDPNVVGKIKRALTDGDRLWTAPELTTNARRFIKDSDIVVATGRGVMEAALSGKVVFFPSAGDWLPQMLTPEGIEHGIYWNFSDRTPSFRQQRTAPSVDLVLDPIWRVVYLSKMKEVAATKFALQTVVDDYLKIYQSARHAEDFSSVHDVFQHLYRFLRGQYIRMVRQKIYA